MLLQPDFWHTLKLKLEKRRHLKEKVNENETYNYNQKTTAEIYMKYNEESVINLSLTRKTKKIKSKWDRGKY